MKEKLLKLLHKIYRHDEFVNNFIDCVNVVYKSADEVILRLNNLFYFDKLDKQSCEWWEKLLILSPAGKNLTDRQAAIRSKWLICVHNDIKLIQNACDSWQNVPSQSAKSAHAVEADFKGGKIILRFIKTIGTPSYLPSLLNAIEIIKPAHIPILTIFRYLIIEEIHEVKSIEEMENLEINMFEFCVNAAY